MKLTAIRVKTFRAWMENSIPEYTEDIVNHGAAEGYPELTYYSDTCRLYEHFSQEIWEALNEDADDMGQTPLELLASFGGANNVTSSVTFQNLMVWYMAERTARQIQDEKKLSKAEGKGEG